VAAAIAGIEYSDNTFRRRRLYTAWDNLKDEEVFFRGVDMLEAAGVPASHLMAFMLVGFDKRETWERIHHRFNRMVARGIMPYPMPFDQTRRDLKRFQRWAVTGLYRTCSFDSYDINAARARRRSGPHGDLFEGDPMIRTLPRQIAAFDRRFPQLRTADGAYILCCWAASNFCAEVPGACVIYLLGSRRYFPRRVDD
jgi:hypothetical protein